MARGFEIPQHVYTAEDMKDQQEAKRQERIAKAALPYGRALDDADFLLMLQEGFGGNRGAVLRRRLLAHCFRTYRGAIVLNEREREVLAKFLRGDVPGPAGAVREGKGFEVPPIEPWGDIPMPWE